MCIRDRLWWLLKQLYGKNLLYKGYTIQPYSPAAGTGLSSHELNQPCLLYTSLPQEAAEVGVPYGDLCEKLIEISLKNFKA